MKVSFKGNYHANKTYEWPTPMRAHHAYNIFILNDKLTIAEIVMNYVIIYAAKVRQSVMIIKISNSRSVTRVSQNE